MEIQNVEGSPFSCHPNAMSSEQRKRYRVLMKSLNFKGGERTERPDGFIFALPKNLRGYSRGLRMDHL